MARPATTLDLFSAIEEREIGVNELVNMLGWPQPTVSKRLAGPMFMSYPSRRTPSTA